MSKRLIHISDTQADADYSVPQQTLESIASTRVICVFHVLLSGHSTTLHYYHAYAMKTYSPVQEFASRRLCKRLLIPHPLLFQRTRSSKLSRAHKWICNTPPRRMYGRGRKRACSLPWPLNGLSPRRFPFGLCPTLGLSVRPRPSARPESGRPKCNKCAPRALARQSVCVNKPGAASFSVESRIMLSLP